MSELIEMLCKGNVIVQLNNGNQEREFRNICKELNKKYGNINLSHKDGTAYKDTENEKKPIYPLFHNFHKCQHDSHNFHIFESLKIQIFEHFYLTKLFKSLIFKPHFHF